MQTHRARDYMLRVALNCVAGGIALHGILQKYITTHGMCHVEEQHYFTTTKMNVLG